MSKYDELKPAIAKALDGNGGGLHRAEIYRKTSDDVDGIQDISWALNEMLNTGHVQKSTERSSKGFQWMLTAAGKSLYLTPEINPEARPAQPEKKLEKKLEKKPERKSSRHNGAHSIDRRLDRVQTIIQQAAEAQAVRNREQKIHVLTRLAQILDAEIAEILQDIINDLTPQENP